ncbi:hypothetical protein GCM10023189_38430 [Nibrella saemangeumensis]|uniref:Curli production assembly/transport component CsgE n=1 Tax=Nibrella saemangeumensis TaxID=1084526 RepID=A0ABP8N6C9_9BACT
MKAILALLLTAMPFLAVCQNSSAEGDPDVARMLAEFALREPTGTTLILDNSRTKAGRDFYDLFYRHWAAPSALPDTTQAMSLSATLVDGEWVIITIEEIPAPGTASQILIRLDDQPVWQQFVQARYEILEEATLQAVEVIREALFSSQKLRQQLNRGVDK